MKDINVSLISKLGWKLLTQHDILWVSLFPRKYFKYGNLLSSPLALGSWIWNGIKSTVPLLSFGACFIPYNAFRLPIWSSPWIPTILNFMPMHPLMISDLFSSGFTSFDDFRSHPCYYCVLDASFIAFSFPSRQS
jgi:hypothetical protein